MSDTFCILPWIHLYANADGSVIPCCIAHHHDHLGNVRDKTIEEIWNNDGYKNLRKNMLSGVRSSNCRACYKNEDIGITSARETANYKYRRFIPLKDLTNTDGSLDDVSLKYLDIRWSNICNLKCRSCSPTYSSSWAKEDGRPNVFIFSGGENNDDFYNQIKPHLLNIEEFYFAGGEPLLTDKHYEILNYLLEHGRTDVRIRYNTNMSVLKYKDQNVIDLWKHFPTIFVGASLDSWGDRAEYIRDGSTWSNIEKNIKEIQNKCPHVNLQISTVVSVFNIYTLPVFYEYLIQKELFEPNVDISLYCIQNPDIYTFSVLNDTFKNKIYDKFRNLNTNSIFDDRLKDVIKTLESSKYDETLHKRFIATTKFYDSKRQQNFCETFPELNEIWID